MDRRAVIAFVVFVITVLFMAIAGESALAGGRSDSALSTKAKRTMKHATPQLEKATFGAGCFWSVEAAFRAVPGVVSTQVGYAGGTVPQPSYEQVCSGVTGHTEAVEVTFNPDRVTYAELLDVFWRKHDPTAVRKLQYRSVIFYHSATQKKAALESVAVATTTGRFQNPVLTQIEPAPPFWRAEAYHQQYLARGKTAYCPS